MNGVFRRRDFLLTALAAPIASGLALPPSRSVRSFRLIEQAGLRRFGYPVRTVVPDAVEGRNFRLLRDGRVIPAQFRAVEVTPGRRELVLDFNAGPEPLETQRYEVIFGPEVEPGPEPKGGVKVEERDGRFSIAQSSSLIFEFSKRAAGFLESVVSSRLEYLRDGSGGLSIVENDSKAQPGRAPDRDKLTASTKVSRQGPMAVGLRSEWSGPSGQPVTLDLTIPQSKSWVQAVWSVDDPDRRVSSLVLDLNLRIEGSSTLIDLGAGSTNYGQIKGKQRMELAAGRGEGTPESWVVRQGEGDKPGVFAASTAGSPRQAEGWAHVTDARRCTALAVADFGKLGNRDRISIEADGHLQLSREFEEAPVGSPPNPRTLAFWLHFVPMPVQVGAATSPQAILAPLKVEWDR